MEIGCIDYGAGNLASIVNGIRSVDGKAGIVASCDELGNYDAIVLPGVGSFGAAMRGLAPYREALIDEISSGKPFLGICLGLQALFEGSDEGDNASGLGIFRGWCKRFEGNMKVPHMGWNSIEKKMEHPILSDIDDGTYFYFVHSYHAVPVDLSYAATLTDYGGGFVSSVAKDNVFACQFHPEKSSDAGLMVLRNFLKFCKT